MLDELKVEERPRWDDKTNKIQGTCREHSENESLAFTSKHEPELLMDALHKGEVHLAVEVSTKGPVLPFVCSHAFLSGDCWRCRRDQL